MPAKADLRDRSRETRRLMNAEEYQEASIQVVSRARTLPEIERAQTVHTYWPNLDDREPDFRSLIEELATRNVQITVPVVEVFSRHSTEPRLSHVEYTPGMKMAPNRWGIMEPVERRTMPSDTFDLIVVPALACDAHGVRLGHGYGYYDEFLAQTPGIRLCLCLDSLVVDLIPADPHDQRMDIIVTQTRTIRPPKRILP